MLKKKYVKSKDEYEVTFELPSEARDAVLVCSAIAIWKCLDRTDLDDEKANLLSAVSKVVSRLIGH